MTVRVLQRDERSAEFFDATAEGRLMLRRCEKCGHIGVPQTEFCPRCGSEELTWTDSEGTGVITAYGVVHARSAEGAPRTPIAIVELDEGPWIYAQIVDADPDAVGVGTRVRVGFERPEGGEAVPVFRPETGG